MPRGSTSRGSCASRSTTADPCVNFLELCQEFVGEYGLAGGTGPDTVVGQKGELGNVVRWIRDASLDLDNRWEDWRYLWLQFYGTLPAQIDFPTPVAQPGVFARRWQTKALRYRSLNPLGSSWTPLAYVEFQRFQVKYDPDIATPGAPSVFTVMPDNTLKFDKPADQAYQLKGAFYRLPPVMKADADQPAIPEQYQRIIRVRALKYYADREDAPELVRAAVTEYPDLLEKLERAYLDARRAQGAASQIEEQAGIDSAHEAAWG